MSRGLQAAIVSAIGSTSLTPIMLYDGTWASGAARFWTGLGDLVWNGNTYTGIGLLGGISEATETTDTRIEGITVQLSGVPSNQISLALGQARQGLPGKLYVGVRDASGVVTADVWFIGRMDVVSIDDSGETSTISVRYLSRLGDMRKANGRRFTAADLKSEYPDDLALDFLPTVQDQSVVWGGGWRWP